MKVSRTDAKFFEVQLPDDTISALEVRKWIIKDLQGRRGSTLWRSSFCARPDAEAIGHAFVRTLLGATAMLALRCLHEDGNHYECPSSNHK